MPQKCNWCTCMCNLMCTFFDYQILNQLCVHCHMVFQFHKIQNEVKNLLDDLIVKIDNKSDLENSNKSYLIPINDFDELPCYSELDKEKENVLENVLVVGNPIMEIGLNYKFKRNKIEKALFKIEITDIFNQCLNDIDLNDIDKNKCDLIKKNLFSIQVIIKNNNLFSSEFLYSPSKKFKMS